MLAADLFDQALEKASQEGMQKAQQKAADSAQQAASQAKDNAVNSARGAKQNAEDSAISAQQNAEDKAFSAQQNAQSNAEGRLLHPMQPKSSGGRFYLFLYGGRTMLGRTSYATQVPGTQINSSDVGSGSGLYGVEFTAKVIPHFKLGPVAELSTYHFNDGSAGDRQIGLYLMPRGQINLGTGVAWLGLGLGAMQTAFGAPSTAVQSSLWLSSSSMPATSWGWAVSPRLGWETKISDTFLIGGQVSYVITRTTVTGVAPFAFVAPGATNQTSSYSQQMTRRWLGLALRLGAKF